MLYWQQGDYLGFGSAAHSHRAGRRWWNLRTPERYIAAVEAGEDVTKIVGWLGVGALAGALTTVSLQTVARGNMAPLPLEELQQLAAVFSKIGRAHV